MSIQSARLHNSSAGMTALPHLEADRRGPICALTAVNFVSRSVSRVEIDDGQYWRPWQGIIELN